MVGIVLSLFTFGEHRHICDKAADFLSLKPTHTNSLSLPLGSLSLILKVKSDDPRTGTTLLGSTGP